MGGRELGGSEGRRREGGREERGRVGGRVGGMEGVWVGELGRE